MRPAACLLLSLSLLSSITGCTVWGRQPPPVTVPSAYQQYQVWTPNSVIILHQVRVERDTLYGIPIADSRDCSGCTVSIPLTEVDSLRTARTEHVGTAIIGAGAGALAVLMVIAGVWAVAGTD